jgi:circadian clock protein KaiC
MNEYPFLIDEKGITVLPITDLQLNHKASKLRVSTGIERLDNMLEGKGYFRGSSILLSGTAGTGKTSVASTLAYATAKNNEKVLYFAFEESPNQIIRNMESIGLNLEPFIKKGLLKFHASRPTLYGLEMHLVTIHKLIEEFDPSVVVFDPISNLTTVGTISETRSMLTRLIDYLKTKQITSFMNVLSSPSGSLEETELGVSSLVDTWILVKDVETEGERNRTLYILKSRGMNHSNQLREFLITDKGIELLDVYSGPQGVLTGTARMTRELMDKVEVKNQKLEHEMKQREIEKKKKILQAKIALLKEMYENEKDEEKILKQEAIMKELYEKKNKNKILTARKADS